MAIQLLFQLIIIKIDIIRDLYINELNSYKPTQAEASSEVGQVKELKLPAAPKPPIVDVDISSELAAYETEELPPLEKENTLVTESIEQKLFAKEETP